MTSSCPGSHCVGFEGEGAGGVSKPTFFTFSLVSVFCPPKNNREKKKKDRKGKRKKQKPKSSVYSNCFPYN